MKITIWVGLIFIEKLYQMWEQRECPDGVLCTALNQIDKDLRNNELYEKVSCDFFDTDLNGVFKKL